MYRKWFDYQVPLYDMKEQMKKLTVRAEYVLSKTTATTQSVQMIDKALSEMEQKILVLYKLTQKDKTKKKLTSEKTIPEKS